MTLKQKLSISRIEHFSLVLEQQYSNAKLFLLHEEELIQEVKLTNMHTVHNGQVFGNNQVYRVCPIVGFDLIQFLEVIAHQS